MSHMSEWKRQFEGKVAESFKDDIRNHRVVQLHRDGDTVRIWKCSDGGSSTFMFTVVAGPNFLYVYGDMGDCSWHRHYDMIPFIRGSIDSTYYFGSKSSRECQIKKPHPELVDCWAKDFREEWIEHHEDDEEYPDGWTESQEDELQRLVGNFDDLPSYDVFLSELLGSDFHHLFEDAEYYPDIEYYTYHYLWLCQGLKWMVEQLDAGNYTKSDQVAQAATFLGSGPND